MGIVIIVIIAYQGTRIDRLISHAEKYEQIWNTHSITSYEYVLFDYSCWGGDETRIKVQDGKVISEILISKDNETAETDYRTIPKLFEFIKMQIQQNPEYQYEITYDKTYGFPDYIKYFDSSADDLETTIWISHFKILD